jgi:hypothetical protein
MTRFTVYHNPNFLDYRGNHSQIVPPAQPVATVTVPAGLILDEMLSMAYARTQHGYEHPSWFNDPDVIPHLRSTSAGDLIADSDGNLYVVESLGFQPLRQAQCRLYQPKAIYPVHKLAEAYRLLETAVNGADTRFLLTLVRQALAAIQHALAAEGYPTSETPILWEKAQPGDLVGGPYMGGLDMWQFRVIARKLRPKWRAKRLLAHVPNGQIWIDSPRTWAVLVPIASNE